MFPLKLSPDLACGAKADACAVKRNESGLIPNAEKGILEKGKI